MKVIDPKSTLIGVLGTLLVFSTLGLRPKTDELGHLVVRSLTIEDDRGVIMGYLGNGYMQTYNQYGEPTLFIGTGKDGVGTCVPIMVMEMSPHMLALEEWEEDT